jgi:Tfp pilus assembly protein PilN
MTPAGPQHAQAPDVSALRPIDLLRERHTIRQEVYARSRRLLVILVAVVLLSAAAILPMQITASAKREATARLTNELTVARAKREEAQRKAALVSANEELLNKHSEEASKTRLWRNLLAELSARVDSGTWIAGLTCKLESSGATVEIKGTAETLRNATRFTRALKASPFFDKAKLDSTQSTAEGDGGVTQFVCDAVLSDGAVKAAGHDTPLRFGSARDDSGGDR